MVCLRLVRGWFGICYFALAGLTLAGCRGGGTPAQTESVTSALNASPKTSDFVVEATNSVRLQTGGMVVSGGDIGALGTTGPFLGDGVAVDALTGVQVQTTHTIIGYSVNLGTGAQVGDIEATHVTVGTGAAHGTIAALVPLPSIPAAAVVSPGTSNITVGTGATVSTSPGHYAAVSVGTGGTLKLAAGSYDMSSLTLSTGAKLQALGAVQVHVAGKVSTSSGAIIGAASGVTLTAGGFRIEVSGQNGTTGALTATPPAASFGTGNSVTALILVPNGSLVFGTGAVATGAFMGRDVDIAGSGTKFVYQDGFPNACNAQSCDDGNPCTVDSCGTNGCTHTPAANGTACNDGNACTQTDTCQLGVCTGSNPVTCTASDQCHTAGSCNPSTGVCSNPNAPNGQSCNDGNSCTTGDSCQNGTCSGTAVSCTALDACHVAGTCNPSTGVCSNPNAPNGQTCNDGNACTSGDSCQNGTCAGAAVSCTAFDACHVAGTCNPSTGTCSNPNAPNGQTCNDGNACTTGDSCQNGTCTGTAVSCTSLDACHVAGTCNPSTGACSNPSAPNGQSCNDGNACTTGDACQGGVCTGTAVTCTAQDQCHTAGTCNPSDGTCSNPAAANGTACNDGDACTTGETCQSGTCNGGTPVTCPGADQCNTVGACVPASGCPAPVAKGNGTPCNDGNACTQTDSCQGGTCTGSNSVTCKALDACHAVGTCAPATGVCSNPLQPVGTTCGTGETCTADGQCLTPGHTLVVNAGPDQTLSELLGAPPPSFTLQQISNTFTAPVGIEYYQPTNEMIMSVYCCSGEPHNFDMVDSQGNHQQYTNINGLGDEVYFAIARDEGGGLSRGGFPVGEMLVGTGAPGTIARVSPDGSTIENPWVVLPGENGLLRGQLQLDRTGLYGGDLLVTTTAGHLWRVTSAGATTQIPVTLPGGFVEGLAAIPDDPVRYGPWAGKVLTGDEGVDGINATDAEGNTTTVHLGIFPENIMVVPAKENFFGVDWGASTLWGASASQFTGMIGDVLIAEEFGGALWDVRWNGSSFDKTLLARVNLWEHTAFGPAGISQVGQPGVSTPLNGTVTDDGAPAGSTLTVRWTMISGPGPVNFTNSQLAATSATFTAPGTYVLQLSASDGQLTSTSETTVVVQSVDPANQPPVANAGPDQTITLPAAAHLTGSATDDGLPVGSFITTSWSQVSGPGTATFVNPNAAFTDVLFSAPGAYVLQLTASDTELTGTSTVTITVNPAPSLVGGQLTASLSSPGPLATGSVETLTVFLTDSSANPIINFPVQVVVTGANPGSGTVVTDATGHAIFSYFGSNVGTDVLTATVVSGATQLQSTPQSVAWTVNGGAVVTQGWIAYPTHQATVMGQVPIVLSNTVTLASGTVSYWPTANPSDVTIIDSNAHGTPGATIATLDTTTLKNGSYIVDLTGVDNQGNTQDSEIAVTVSGDYKPGRLVVEVTDLTIPLVGLPITIGRRYDSLDKDNVSDFGNGWSLTIGHPDLQVDPANNVTMTMPGGRRVTFGFVPRSYPFPFEYLFQPAYLPAPGVFGTLTSDGCPLLEPTGSQILCFEDANPNYAPTTYTYTDAYGVVYTMGADGTLKSIRDRNGNTLTFAPTGIQSSAGNLAVSFTRDAQNRITKIVTPPIDSSGTTNEYDYGYDGAGDLSNVQLPPGSGPITLQYTYDGVHRLLTAVDANGNPARTSTYDDAGRLLTDTDGLGNVTSYAHDVTGHTTTTTFPDKGVLTQTFDDRGLLLSQTDQLGRTTTHQYDANENETKRTNALGEATVYTYDGNGNQTSRTNALGETRVTTYNAFSEPLTTTNPIGNTTTVSYDDSGLPTNFSDSVGPLATFTSLPQGLPTTITDPLGNIITLAYDAFGNLVSRADRLSRTTNYTYDGLGRKTGTVDPRGGVTTYAYLPSSMQSGTVDPVGDTKSMTYDGNGNLTATTDTFGPRTTTQAYDVDNHRTRAQNADGTAVTETRDFRGNLLTSTDESGNTTSYAYDLAGELTQTTYADGTFVTQIYDALGRLQFKTDERGNTTSYSYEPGCDCTDRLTSVTDPLGRTTSTTYDGMGRKTSMTDASGHQTFYAYDLRGHLTETDYADGTATHDTYDMLGRRISSADQAGATTQYGYDAEGQLMSVTDPLGNLTRYAYDDGGNLSVVTDANNHATSYVYDPDNRKTGRTLPLGMSETFSYDLVGNNISHTDFRGKTTTYAFDLLNRLVSKTPDPSLGEPTVSYGYNPNSTRANMTDASGATAYTYDARNRLKTKVTPEGTLTYAYDASGNVASIDSSNANGTSVAYAWDAANQLSTVTDNRLGGMTTAAYTATGQPFTLTQPNGVGVTYGYDQLVRVSSMAWQQGTNSALESWAYGYNPRGQRISSTEITGREATYGYDDAARFTSETITGDPSGPTGNGLITYVIDAVGNRSSRTSTLAALGAQSFSYDSNDELTSDGYDLDGNTTSSDGHTYRYDFEDRLLSKDGGAVTLIYDGDGNRVAKTVMGVTTQYLVDELNPTGYLQVMDEVSGGAVQVRYTFGNMLVSQARNDGGTFVPSFYGYDAHGNITFLVDTLGQTQNTYSYDAWGNIVAATGETANNRLYSGEEFDADLGLINLRARFYSSATGRFLTRDTANQPVQNSYDILGTPSRQHPYLYAANNPTVLVDPSGHLEGVEEGTLIGLIAAAALTQTTVALGTNGQQTIVTAPLAFALAYKANCVFLTVADQLAQRLLTATSPGAVTPPFAYPFEDCTGCKPCVGPLPPPGQRLDTTHGHWPCSGPHIHLWHWEWQQNPKSCQCFTKKIDDGVICL